MKIMIIILASTVLLPTLRAEDPLPPDVQRVVAQRSAAVAKIDNIYLQELDKLKANYTKQGNLDVALKIDLLAKGLVMEDSMSGVKDATEGIKMAEPIEDFLKGDWILRVPGINHTENRAFRGRQLYWSDGTRVSWVKAKNGIKIDAGSVKLGSEELTIDPNQPNVMQGVHSKNPSSKFSYSRKNPRL